LNREWHVLEELVGSALARLQRGLSTHVVNVQLPDNFPLILVDGFLLEQALVNLLENASRYTPPGTRIDISARMVGNRVELRIADNGSGLPPGTEDKVFDKFFRATTATADGRRGVGLGLAICQGIVEAHGGNISASNRPSGGAEFVMSLPCEQQAPEVALSQAHAPAST
jgi:two-component system sensor histidine kinase KdpD